MKKDTINRIPLTEGNYLTIHKSILNDERLNRDEIFIMLNALNNDPEKFDLWITALCKKYKICTKNQRKYTLHLEELGYIERTISAATKGGKRGEHFKTKYRYTINESPFNKGNQCVVFNGIHSNEHQLTQPNNTKYNNAPNSKARKLSEVELLNLQYSLIGADKRREIEEKLESLRLAQIELNKQEEIYFQEKRPAVQLQSEPEITSDYHSNIEDKAKNDDTAGLAQKNEVEKAGISNPTEVLGVKTEIYEQVKTDSITLSSQELTSEEPVYENWIPKLSKSDQQLAIASTNQIDLDELNGKDDLTYEDRLLVFESLKQRFVARASEFSSERVMAERLHSYAMKLNDNNFKSGGKTISRWNSFLNAAVTGIIDELNKSEIQKVKEKEASQRRTAFQLMKNEEERSQKLDQFGNKLAGIRYGEGTATLNYEYERQVSREEEETNQLFASDKFKRKQVKSNVNLEDLF